jgi:hypothetical protein
MNALFLLLFPLFSLAGSSAPKAAAPSWAFSCKANRRLECPPSGKVCTQESISSVELELSPKAAEVSLYSLQVRGEPIVRVSAGEISFFLSGLAEGAAPKQEITGLIHRHTKALRLLQGDSIYTGICESK